MCGTDAVSAFASTCGYARRLRAGLVLALLLALTGCAGAAPAPAPASTPLHGKVICVDPGHGGTAATDPFRVGPAGEREEWINLRVALALRELLERSGAHVVMTRTEDVAVPLADRAHLARYARADVFISIHHNATADPAVNLPIVYFHGNASENLAGVALGRILLRRVRRALYTDATPIALVSDLAIYPGSGASVLRNTYGIPAVICEASFFTDPDEEQRLRALSYNRREALAYLESLGEFLGAPVPPIAEKRLGIPPFPVLEAAARSSGAALRWNDLYREGVALARDDADRAIRARALALLTESVRVFPDSPVARAAHLTRARLLAGLGRDGDAEVERLRAREHYVAIE
jgi:N-acetylmuramoyl-L-alanine amidase